MSIIFISASNTNAGNSLFNPKKLLKNIKFQNSDEELESMYTSVDTVLLKKISPFPTYFYGEVEPIRSLDVSFNFSGKIANIKKAGSYVVSEITNNEGKVIRPASIIASFNQKELKQNLLQAGIEKKMAEEDVRLQNQDIEIMTKLSKSHAIADRKYNIAKSSYNKALLALKSAELNFDKAFQTYENRNIKAPFTGIIEDTYVTPGEFVINNQPVAKVTKIDTVIVKLELLPTLKNLLKNNTFFQVYPEGESTPVKGWMLNNIPTHNAVDIYVKNKLTLGTGKNINSSIKNIYQVFPVMKIYNENPNDILNMNYKDTEKIPLAVPVESIHKDEKGHFIYVADSNHFNNAFRINYKSIFKIKKIYIKPGKIFKKFVMANNSEIDLRSITESNGLKLGDVVVVKGADGLTEKNKVKLVEKHWLFYPGQKIKVKIPRLSRTGYYVPPEAIISTDRHSNYVYILKNNNKAKLSKVNITGYSKGFYAISGIDLKEDEKVIIIDDPSLYTKLYDGAEVIVKNTYDPSSYLKRNSVKRKYELNFNNYIEPQNKPANMSAYKIIDSSS